MTTKEKGYDLHCHTRASDGELILEKLALLAKDIGLEGFCVTDHDTLKSSRKAKLVSELTGLEIIPGIELSGKIEDYLIDITGYFIDPTNKKLEEVCRINRDFRKARIGEAIIKLNETYKKILGKDISYDEVLNMTIEGSAEEQDSEASICLKHINKVLIKRGLSEGRNAFKRAGWLSRTNPDGCYVERKSVEFNYAIDAIIDAGGVVGIPHPALVPYDYRNLTDQSFFELIKSYVGKEKGIQIIETEYPYKKVRSECGIDEKREQFWREIVKEYNLIGAGGSDGHQAPPKEPILDSSKVYPILGDRTTSKETVEKIRLLSKK